MFNSFVAIWPFGGLSSFDLPSRTFWDPITYTPFQLKLEAETLGGYFLEMIMEAMLDFPGHTGIPHGMTCFFFLVGNCQQRSHHILHLGIFWKTWCPCPPDLSTGCRSECQQRSTAKVKVDEGNGPKKSSENGLLPVDDHFASMGQFGTPKSITCSTVSILSYLLFGTIGNWWILGHRLETQQLNIYWLLKCRAPFCH